MPNRGEIEVPSRRRYSRAVAAQADAWPIIGFCALGALMSIYAAITTLGFDALARAVVPF